MWLCEFRDIYGYIHINRIKVYLKDDRLARNGGKTNIRNSLLVLILRDI